MFKRKTDPTVKRVHVHSAVEIKFNEKITYAIAENGTVTITCVSEEPDEFDEVVIPAYLIFKIGEMLNATRLRIKNVPREIVTE